MGATVAQVVERLIRNQGVSGSSPLSGSNKFKRGSVKIWLSPFFFAR